MSREYPDPGTLKDNTLAVYWSNLQFRWVTVRLTQSKKFKNFIKSKPRELFMRTAVNDLVIDFPLVTSQWETAAENAWVDNSKKAFNFRILNRPEDSLNLAIIETERKAKFKAGDRVLFTQDWGKQVCHNQDFEVTLIRAGTPARVVIVGDDNMSYCVETSIGKFSWVRENYLRMNKFYRFVRFLI